MNQKSMILTLAHPNLLFHYLYFLYCYRDQLRRDGNLRDDIKIPEYDPEGNPIVNGRSTGETWDKLRQRLEAPAEEKADIQVLPDTKTGKK
ncbi:hypothetical protein BVG19_g4519 [[Candida] boidinii]|nr:hypothetical protein BVG19_g4519 [[Candida] boidinii]